MTAVATARLTCEACPVQIEGTLEDGRWFYFNARYRRVILSASPVSVEDAARVGAFGGGARVRIDMPELDEFGAGMIGEDEAWAMLHEMVGEL